MEEQKKCCCHHGGEISDVEARVRTRTDEEYKKLLNRLNRIEAVSYTHLTLPTIA